jgi:hypothetical protein
MEENKRLLEANNVSTSGTTCQPITKTEVTSTTPDYAAGLAPLNPPTPAPSTPQHVPSYIAPATPIPAEPLNEPASMYNYNKNNNNFIFKVFFFISLCYIKEY